MLVTNVKLREHCIIAVVCSAAQIAIVSLAHNVQENLSATCEITSLPIISFPGDPRNEVCISFRSVLWTLNIVGFFFFFVPA